MRRAACAWSAERSRVGPGVDAGNAAEVEALQGRVRELEGQLSESKRLLELRNAELAQLQAQLAADAAGAPTPTTAPVEPAAPQPEATRPRSRRAPKPRTDACAPKPPPTERRPPRRRRAARPPAATPAEATASLVDTLIEYWWVPGRSASWCCSVSAVRHSPSPRQAARSPNSTTTWAASPSSGEDRLAQPPARSPTRAACALRRGRAIPDDIARRGIRHASRACRKRRTSPLAPRASRTDETISSETAINLDQGDPLAEADFHMAYGLYDQAADLVRIAIQREPDRRDLKLKLLEVFFVWGNKEQFLQTARELAETREQAAPGEWEKIVIMGKQLAPEDPLFAGGSRRRRHSVGVDLDLEGGESRVDFDPLGEPVPMEPAGVDLDSPASSARRSASGDCVDPDVTGDEP